jgi:predicted ATPase
MESAKERRDMTTFPCITELRIEGFKSFGSPMQHIALGPLTFIVGANASGKTNMLAALQFLKMAVLQNAEYACNEFGGTSEVRNRIMRERNTKKPVVIGFKMDMGGAGLEISPGEYLRMYSFDYEVRLDLRHADGIPRIEQEILLGDIRDLEDNTRKFSLLRKKEKVTLIDDVTPSNGKNERNYSVPPEDSTRLALGVGFFSTPCAILRRLIEEWRFYNISPAQARIPTRELPDMDMGPAGENLAVMLHKLEQQNGKGNFDAVAAELRSVIPGFQSVKTNQSRSEGKWSFQVLENRIQGAMNPNSVSDGTIRLLALAVIANWKSKVSSLIAIEEPENGLHPHLSEHIVQILRTASEERQLLITTHNPEFLNCAEPEEVVMCDKTDGLTLIRKASDVADIQAFRKHFSLGELWIQGTLGGMP